ncbi:MAG: hypothetical protein NT067_05575 [Candidatus Diapherotrites archaeon]|nr:hypothetical protein [Candidatus Diapherotrites archaeon]
MKNQKGVSPLIATVLLLLVCMAVGVIIWQWVTSFQGNVQTESTKTQQKMTGCADVSLTADLTDIKPTWYSALKATKVLVKNGSGRDLNTFKVYSYYSDGNSDVNSVSLNITGGGQAVAWTQGGAGTGGTKPTRVIVESTECGIKLEVPGTSIQSG